MDYFDSNMKDKLSEYDSNLPSGMDWEDMREGVYKKMDKRDAGSSWKWLSICLLLLMGGCGSWFAINYINDQGEEVVEQSIAETSTVLLDEKNGNHKEELISRENKRNDQSRKFDESKNDQIENTLQRTEQKNVNSIISQKATSTTSISDNVLQSEPSESQIQFININQTKSQGELADNHNGDGFPHGNNSDIFRKELKRLSNKEGLLKVEDRKMENGQLQIEHKTENQNPPINTEFKSKFSAGILGGVANWNASTGENTNSKYVSGFPGVSAKVFLQYALSEKNAFQLGYQYSFLQELFDYESTKKIEVEKPNTLVRQYVSSLTGNNLHQSYGDTSAQATRYIREFKYNAFRLHTLQVQYLRSIALSKKVSLQLAVGGEYLFHVTGKGKRLNEDNDIITFDKNKPIFANNQFALNVAFIYQYRIAKRTYLLTQVAGAKYLTNWELRSNGETKPFTYNLSIGLRQEF